MGLPRRALTDIKSRDSKDWIDHVFEDDYPTIMAFLKDEKFDDGTPRMPGTISLFCKGGCLTFAINDRVRNVTAYVNAHTFVEALDLIERGIFDDSLDWKTKQAYGSDKKIPY